MFIKKKLPRPHALHEPILHADHRRPVTRRELLSAGLMGTTGMIMAPAWLASSPARPAGRPFPSTATSRRCCRPASATSVRAPA
jgi:hypothetical protein